jgi:hypothetical protein
VKNADDQKTVIPAQERHPGMTLSGAGIQFVGLAALKLNQIGNLDSSVRRNDGRFFGRIGNTHKL